MHNNNTIKLLKLQGKNLKIEKEIIDDINNEAYFLSLEKLNLANVLIVIPLLNMFMITEINILDIHLLMALKLFLFFIKLV